jgi:hypothetical protein
MPLAFASRRIVHRLPDSRRRQAREAAIVSKEISLLTGPSAGRVPSWGSKPQGVQSTPSAIHRIAETRRARLPKPLQVFSYRHGCDPPLPFLSKSICIV